MKHLQIIINRYINCSLFLFTLTLQAQVGINTTTPMSSLDIKSSSQNTPTNTDGVLIPTLDAFPITNPTGFQDGMLVFFTGNALQAKGFYYWDDSLDTWVFYGGVNRIHQLDDGSSYFVNTTDLGTNVVFGEIEEFYTQYPNTYSNDMVSYNTVVGYKSMFGYWPYSYATAVGYNATRSINRPSLGLEKSTVFGYHDINAYNYNQIILSSFAHLVKVGGTFGSFAIGKAYGDSTFDIWQRPGTELGEGEHETYIGSYFGNIYDVFSDSVMLYWSRITTLGYGYETLPNETLNSSKLFFDSGNDILQCRAKDVLRGIHYDVGQNFGFGSHRWARFTISVGYRELYAYNPIPYVRHDQTYQNISLGYLAHDKLAWVDDPINDLYINNIAIGSYAMYSSETVGNSIAIGENALRLNTGDQNIAIGKDAMNQHGFGDGNTALGSDALSRNISSIDNVALGKSAGYNASGDENTFVGAFASNGLATHFKDGSINIGAFSGYVDTNADRLYIENSSGTTPLIGGDFIYKSVGINRNINSLFNTFEVGGTASKSTAGNWWANSDGRLKKNILDISSTAALNRITKLNGVSYFWNDTKTGNIRPENIQYGFIAQDLMQVFPEHVVKDKQGFYQTAYGTHDAFVVEAIKELQTKFNDNDSELNALESRFKRIENLLSKAD
jgi:hypothetical protein